MSWSVELAKALDWVRSFQEPRGAKTIDTQAGLDLSEVLLHVFSNDISFEIDGCPDTFAPQGRDG